VAKRKGFTRDTIIRTLVGALKPLNYAHAFYEGGAVAFNRTDEWSDIDLYIIVDDTRVKETFLAVEKALKSLSPIRRKLEVPQLPYPGAFQAFYKLDNASEYLIIDLVILQLNSPEKFLEPKIHGNVIFYFNKNGKITSNPLDIDAFVKKLHARLERLKARFDMFNNFVQKELNRGNYLEAIDLYRALTLATLVEILRIKQNPLHYDFGMRYVHYELPKEAIKKLESLYFAKDAKDLQEKYLEATNWFHELMLEIDGEQIEKLVRTP